MKVLAHKLMNTARWGSMSTTDKEEAVQCLCECGKQNIEHVMSECEYMVDYLFVMVETVNYETMHCRLSERLHRGSG